VPGDSVCQISVLAGVNAIKSRANHGNSGQLAIWCALERALVRGTVDP
jgi:hypothetical protein